MAELAGDIRDHRVFVQQPGCHGRGLRRVAAKAQEGDTRGQPPTSGRRSRRLLLRVLLPGRDVEPILRTEVADSMLDRGLLFGVDHREERRRMTARTDRVIEDHTFDPVPGFSFDLESIATERVRPSHTWNLRVLHGSLIKDPGDRVARGRRQREGMSRPGV